MLRAFQHFGSCAGLDHLTGVHDGDPVAHVGHNAEVVGDQQDRHALGVAQVEQQVEDLGLDRDVEGCGGFIRDKDPGGPGQGECNRDALGHATGELVRVAGVDLLHPGDADRAE